jgi:hypothetical protein
MGEREDIASRRPQDGGSACGGRAFDFSNSTL